jgi:gluconate 2-dehydrogenase gamma chain
MTSQDLLASAHVSAATRAALTQRLAATGAAYEPQFLAPETYRLLEAVAARLFPQPERPVPIPLAPAIDQRSPMAGATMPYPPTARPTASAWAASRK